MEAGGRATHGAVAEAQIAGKASASLLTLLTYIHVGNSRTIAKMMYRNTNVVGAWMRRNDGNAELEDFSHQQTIHELIRGSLDTL